MAITGKKLERLLAPLTYLAAAELDVTGRELRKMRMVPSGGRGPSAPEYAPENIATFLIGAFGSANANGAARAVLDLAPLVPVGGRNASFLYAETFAEAVTSAIEKIEAAGKIVKVRFCQTQPMAEIIWEEVGETRHAVFAAPEIEPDEDGEISVVSAVWAELSGGLLHQLALDLAEDANAADEWTATV